MVHTSSTSKKIFEKLHLAARVILATEESKDIAVQSMRPESQRAIEMFAKYIGAKRLSGRAGERNIPGLFTNQTQKRFEEPSLLIVTDPRTDHQLVSETRYVNIPVIGFCSTDSPLKNIDIAIPGNIEKRHSIGVLYYLLTSFVLEMKGFHERARELY